MAELRMATALPNSLSGPGSDALSCEVWVQVTPDRLNTYAEPASVHGSNPSKNFFSREPMTALLLSIETDSPNWSSAAAFEAVSFACWDHTVPLVLTNTYADPDEEPESSSKGEPTRSVDPFKQTLRPKLSPVALS